MGLSPNEARPSWGVARYLQSQGIRVIPVNPGHDGQTILGERVYATLADIPAAEGVQLVDIFRRSDAVQPIVDEALEQFPDLQTVWMQIGVEHAEAAAKAEARGLERGLHKSERSVGTTNSGTSRASRPEWRNPPHAKSRPLTNAHRPDAAPAASPGSERQG